MAAKDIAAGTRDGDAWFHLIDSTERLATARPLEAIVEVLRDTARSIVGAEGIAVVVREEDKNFYAAEDFIGPLRNGSRFPLESCVSSWAMRIGETARISDSRMDGRVPPAAYAPARRDSFAGRR